MNISCIEALTISRVLGFDRLIEPLRREHQRAKPKMGRVVMEQSLNVAPRMLSWSCTPGSSTIT